MSNKWGKRKKQELAKQQQAGAVNAPAFNVAGVQVQRTQTRRAPIPQAAELREYRDLDPRLYEAIVNEFEANGAHRRNMEALDAADRNRLIRAVTRNDTFGLWFSAFFSVACVGLAAGFVYFDKPAGALLGVLGLLPPIIGVFRRRIKVEPPHPQ